MRSRGRLFLGLSLVLAALMFVARAAAAEANADRVVRLAELEIDPAQSQAYTDALKQEIAASIRLEPGVLTLYAVAVKDHPAQIRLFEMYASAAAYEAHVRSPHFLRYKAATEGMVKSLRLLETEPVMLGSKVCGWLSDPTYDGKSVLDCLPHYVEVRR